MRERADVRRNIGLVFQDPTLDAYLTAEQNLRFHAELYGMPKTWYRTGCGEVLEMVGLWERRAGRVQTFSGGMRRRLEIARGLMHSPRVLFLDEPTVGLDPQTRASIWTYIHELREREEITIFLTTHYMDRPRTAIASRSWTPARSPSSTHRPAQGEHRHKTASRSPPGRRCGDRRTPASGWGIAAEMHDGMRDVRGRQR